MRNCFSKTLIKKTTGTRRILERIPQHNPEYQPHQKSFRMG